MARDSAFQVAIYSTLKPLLPDKLTRDHPPMISIVLECAYIVASALKLVFYLCNWFFIFQWVPINFKDRCISLLSWDKNTYPVRMLISWQHYYQNPTSNKHSLIPNFVFLYIWDLTCKSFSLTHSWKLWAPFPAIH